MRQILLNRERKKKLMCVLIKDWKLWITETEIFGKLTSPSMFKALVNQLKKTVALTQFILLAYNTE